MKNHKFFLSLLLIIPIFLISCSSNPITFLEILENNGTKSEEIKNAEISTTMIDPKSDTKLDENNAQELLSKLNEFTYKKIKNSDEKGWQYLFTFKKENTSKNPLSISVMQNKLLIGEEAYEIVNFDENSFKEFVLKFFNN